MGDVNRIVLIGTVEEDAKTSIVGAKESEKTTFRVSTQVGKSKYPDRTTVVCWDDLARDVCGLRKGHRVYVEGSLRIRSYEQDGVKKYATEVNAHVVDVFGKPVQVDTAHSSPQPEPHHDNPEDEIPF